MKRPSIKSNSLSINDIYPTLLNQVRETLIEGQRRIEQERVRTYWEAGRIILRDILEHADRADYGVEIIKRLAKDLNTNLSDLHRCVQFAKVYPKMPIVGSSRQLSWTHFRKLITVPDNKKRAFLEKAALQNNWTVQELTERIKDTRTLSDSNEEPSTPRLELKISSQKSSNSKLLTPLRGTLYTYQIIKRPNTAAPNEPEFFLDLGFGNFQDLSPADQAKFSDKTIVESRPREDKFKLFESERTVKDLYTYRAVVEKVIDGDTLKVRFQIGFGFSHRETLRLRGLDCPEIDTKEGVAAKIFVQTYIKESQILTVRSSRSDKYDRYLADVFISTSEDPDPQTDLYLNNLLLENNHAVRMD